MNENLSGVGQVFESMFDTFGKYRPGPTAEDLKAQAEAAQKTSKVIFKGHKNFTYILSNAKDAEKYNVDMGILIDGISKKTHVLFGKSKEFLPTSEFGPTWIVNLEWGEFELIEEIITPLKSAKENSYAEVIPANTGSAD